MRTLGEGGKKREQETEETRRVEGEDSEGGGGRGQSSNSATSLKAGEWDGDTNSQVGLCCCLRDTQKRVWEQE